MDDALVAVPVVAEPSWTVSGLLLLVHLAHIPINTPSQLSDKTHRRDKYKLKRTRLSSPPKALFRNIEIGPDAPI